MRDGRVLAQGRNKTFPYTSDPLQAPRPDPRCNSVAIIICYSFFTMFLYHVWSLSLCLRLRLHRFLFVYDINYHINKHNSKPEWFVPYDLIELCVFRSPEEWWYSIVLQMKACSLRQRDLWLKTSYWQPTPPDMLNSQLDTASGTVFVSLSFQPQT